MTTPTKIASRPAFKAVGLPYKGKNENNEIAGLWQAFNPRVREIQHITDGAFGICKEADADGSFPYLAAMAVSDATQIPPGMVCWEIPEQTYAVFECALPAIRETYHYAYETWLPASGYEFSGGPDFEYYDEAFDPQTGGPMTIHIPVVKKKA